MSLLSLQDITNKAYGFFRKQRHRQRKEDRIDGLSGGAIAGIAVGSVAVAVIGGFAIFRFAVKKKSFADLIAAIKGIFKKK